MNRKDGIDMKNVHFAIPEIYGETLSYYELLRKLVDKTNEMIDNYNTVPEQIAEAVANLDASQLFSAVLNQLIHSIATDNTKSANAVKVYKKHDLLYATFNDTVNLYESLIDFSTGTATELIPGTNIREVNISELFIELRKLIDINKNNIEAVKAVANENSASITTIHDDITAIENKNTEQDNEISTLRTMISTPYNFKGDVDSISALPASGNVNDTYYVQDVKYKVTWTGSAWVQSSLSEADYQTELSELKGDIDEVKEHTRNIWENGDVQGTKYAFIPCKLEAGTYTISTVITSSDTNKHESRIEFCSGDTSTIITGVTLDRNIRVNATFTLTEPCTHLLFWASTNSSYSTGDTFKYADIQIEKGEISTNYIKPFTACDYIAREKIESESVVGKIFEYKSNNIVGANNYLISTDYIPCVKKNERIIFNANVNSIGSLIVGFLRSSFENMTNRVVIDDTNINVYSYDGTTTEYKHGLSILNNVTVLIESNSTNEAILTLISNGEIFKQEIRWDRRYNCKLFVRGGSKTNISNVTMSWTCTDMIKDLWIFGDSYLSYTDRWYKYLFQYGYSDNVLINAYPGENSNSAFIDLTSLLKLNTPRCIVWCLGMNDGSDTDSPSATWLDNINNVREICNKLKIELIMATTPTVPTISNVQKNSYVRSSGYRYIDFSNAVGANNEGIWYEGMLSSDGIHPTDKGAKALFGQAITDLPELMIAD